MIRRLRLKLIAINMTIVTAMLLVIFGMLLHFTWEDMENRSVGVMQSIMNDRLRHGGPDGIRLPWFRVSWGAQGERIVVSNGYEPEADALEDVIALAAASREKTDILKSYSLRFLKAPGPQGEQLLFVDISGEIAIMKSLVKTSIFVGMLSFGSFLLLSIWLARWASRPVEEAWNRQRQFVADASHELKTPLTVIMTNAELLQDPQYGQGEKAVFSGSILTMARQMRFLVERLLDLARVDNGTAKMEFTPLDLSELVADSLLPFEPVYFERQLLLESDVEPQVRVKGSENHLKQVLEILLDNGAKYTSPGGRVRVRLFRQGTGCLLTVAGPGETISREELTNIFRRFYRIDKARHRDGSYGLGLSIAESIVTEHGGRIWAESENGVNTFFVQLPARDAVR